jgi:hypothetical protein
MRTRREYDNVWVSLKKGLKLELEVNWAAPGPLTLRLNFKIKLNGNTHTRVLVESLEAMVDGQSIALPSPQAETSTLIALRRKRQKRGVGTSMRPQAPS